jgi:pectate lyase
MKLATPVMNAVLIAVSIGGCATAAQDTQSSDTQLIVATSPTLQTTTTTGPTGSSTSTLAPVVAETLVTDSTTVQPTPVSTMKLTTTTVASTSRPKLSVSQTTNLNPNGTSVTVRGTGYDIAKGVYVIVCTQAAPGTQSTCVGGVNIDGSSPSSVWVSSNPPSYAIGLTTEFQSDGSFNVVLQVVAKSGELDCTLVKCGVVTRSDHLRYSDRTQDVFVPITFNTNP